VFDAIYQEIDEQEEAEMPIINQSSEYYVEEKLIYQFDNDTGILRLDIGKKEYQELLKAFGTFPEEGVSFCFLLPQMGEVCFTGVHKIERIEKEKGRIRIISRIFRRRRK